MWNKKDKMLNYADIVINYMDSGIINHERIKDVTKDDFNKIVEMIRGRFGIVLNETNAEGKRIVKFLSKKKFIFMSMEADSNMICFEANDINWRK